VETRTSGFCTNSTHLCGQIHAITCMC